MLKKELELLTEKQKEEIADLNGDVNSYKRAAEKSAKEARDAKKEAEQLVDQIKQINQSVYTMLQVKYPPELPEDFNDMSDVERFLRYLHSLCADNRCDVSTASNLFASMSRY